MLKKIRNMADRYERNKLCIAIAVLSILIFFAPNYRKGLIEGSDAPFHLARIDSLAQDLSKGIFPVKVHTELGYDYGYGVGLFYQNHFLYLPAFLRLLGCSLETSYKIYLFLIVSAVYLSAFYAAFCISKDKYGASIAAICYLFSHQFISSCYEHFTIGSSVGMIFMPLAIVGMEQFLVKDKPPVLLGIGFGGCLRAHLDRVYGICGMFAFGDSTYKGLMGKSKKNRISFGNGRCSAGAYNILLASYVGSIQGSGIQGIPVMDNS